MQNRVMLLIAAFLIVAGALLFGRASAVARVGETVAFSTLSPFEQLTYGVFSPITSYVEALQQARDLKSDVDTLTSQNEMLTAEVIRLREVETENGRLRQMLQFTERSSLGRLLAAEKIGVDPSNFVRSFHVNRGTNDGVRPGMVVIAAAGLVGRVTETSGPTAKVLQINDASSSINAMVQREESRATGIIVGTATGQMIMRRIEQSESIRVDDIVMTSGLGGNYPKGIVIGKVTRVTQNDVELFQEAVIEPAVRFSKVEDVAILLDFQPIAR
jgi:rod shape-determining protein MreC